MYNEDDFNFNLVGREKVMENLSKLFQLNKALFCGKDWLDITGLKEYRISYYKKKFNINIASYNEFDKPSYILKESSEFLLKEGYILTEDSDNLPPFKKLVWFITYKNSLNTITIKQADWRDVYYIYQLIFNGKIVAEFDITKYKNIGEMGSHLKYTVKELL